MGQRYETNGNYSPSTSFRYASGQNSFQGTGNQHPRRRNDRFRRESLNHSDKIVKQNDTIIRLLKEIRDRLPPLSVKSAAESEALDRADALQSEEFQNENAENQTNSEL
jgi:hypothetical protein